MQFEVPSAPSVIEIDVDLRCSPDKRCSREWHGKTEATSLSLSVRDQSPTALAIGEVAPGYRLAVADSLLDRTEVVS